MSAMDHDCASAYVRYEIDIPGSTDFESLSRFVWRFPSCSGGYCCTS